LKTREGILNVILAMIQSAVSNQVHSDLIGMNLILQEAVDFIPVKSLSSHQINFRFMDNFHFPPLY